MRDAHFHDGDYYETGKRPDVGLAVARMMAHITYLSEESMREKFGRRLQDGDDAALRLRHRLRRSRATSTTRARASSSASTRTRTCT